MTDGSKVHSFLLDPEKYWPEDIKTQQEVTISVHRSVLPLIDFSRFSKYKRLLRCTAYLFRFGNNKLDKLQKKGVLKADELKRAEEFLLKSAQQDAFPEEVNDLNKQGRVSSESSLFQMCPQMDRAGVIRSYGRLKNAQNIKKSLAQPTILPRGHHLTELIIMEFHVKFHHSNNESVVNELRSIYYIPKVRQAVKKVCKTCQWCKVRRAKPIPPQMGNLPEARIRTFAKPFTSVGVDYFGPLIVTVGRRSEKRWGVLFTCLSTRAVHIEIAHKLDADAVILCYQNFVNRRGPVKEIFSDRGTNFIAAEKILKQELRTINHEVVAAKFISPNLL